LHKSDSSPQQQAEAHMLTALQKSLEATFVAGAWLPIELGVKPDGLDLTKKIIVEVYARVGALKGAQLHKAKADLLKLIYVKKKLGPEWRAVICFGSNEAAAFLQGKSWAAEAAREFGVEVVVQELPQEQKQKILAAQQRQRMVNAE
jgi:hypothetical protein